MIDYKNVGKRIKYYRLKAKLRQSDIAETLDVSISYISQLECGTAEVSLKRLDEISTIIKCSLPDLIADIDDSKSSYLNAEILKKTAGWAASEKQLLIDIIDSIEKSRHTR